MSSNQNHENLDTLTLLENELAELVAHALENIAKHAPYYTSHDGLKYLIPVEPTWTVSSSNDTSH